MRKISIQQDQLLVRWILTAVIALFGGIVFLLLHIPLPWLLGPMTAVLVGSRLVKVKLYWPSYLRNSGLIVVGYTIGLSLTVNALIQMGRELPSMLLMTVLTLVLSALFAWVVSKMTGIDYPTLLLGSTPGGLSQMIILAEEMPGVELTVVTFFQVTRLIMIIFFVPLLVFSSLFGNGVKDGSASTIHKTAASWGDLFPNILIFAAAAILLAIIGKKIKLPTPFLLGPIIGTAILSISGVHGPQIPSLLLDISQFLMGGYIGLMMKPEQLHNKTRAVLFALLSGLVLIAMSWVLSLILVVFYQASSVSSFLSTAPGGMDQMGIVAHELHADLSMITGYQMFRIFFILFAVPPFMKWLFKRNFMTKQLNKEGKM
jgi:membrane AbrB-like protein